MPKGNNIGALVLAGGYSSRAQAFKPLLPLGEATIIEKTIDNFFRAGIHNVTVVVGHRAEDLRHVLAALPVRSVYNDRYPEGMFSSIVAGVHSLTPDLEAFFLLPVDIPLVRSHTIRLLHRAFTRLKGDIVYPVFNGRRGHPPLIAAKLIPEIIAGDGTQGLRPILAKHAANACEIKVMDEGILLDADTPEDYRKLVEYYGSRDIPSEAECTEIFQRLRVPEQVVEHCRLVAEVAGKLAAGLHKSGLLLDVSLVIAAGRLHDLAKGLPDHACLGARMLRKMGYPKVAKIVATHHDSEYQAGFSPDEAAVLYLADKLVKNDCIVSIDERFKAPLEKYAADAEALKAIDKRYQSTREIINAVERISGISVTEMITAG